MLCVIDPARNTACSCRALTISENGSRPAIAGPQATFTGRVRVDPLFLKPQPPQRATGSYVTFEPGARSGWHTHPPVLSTRDRSLITVSALVTVGQVAQVPYHLNRAMDNGLTREQASEMLTQLAFVAGWPNVFSALPVFKEVFSARAK